MRFSASNGGNSPIAQNETKVESQNETAATIEYAGKY
jgi:hypothetical protein